MKVCKVFVRFVYFLDDVALVLTRAFVVFLALLEGLRKDDKNSDVFEAS